MYPRLVKPTIFDNFTLNCQKSQAHVSSGLDNFLPTMGGISFMSVCDILY